jgi:hypothetical protein
MPAEKDPKDPSTTSAAYDYMLPNWRKMATVLGGTRAMRAAGKVYLPQHVEESEGAYQERLNQATLLNMTKLTLEGWVGRPFSKPLVFEDVPKEIEDNVLPDVDLQGNDVDVFSREWFSSGLSKGLSHTFIDYPRVVSAENRSLLDDSADGLRPYWVQIEPEQLFFADAEVVGGREILREIRIMEEVTGRNGMVETSEPQIRRVYLRNENGVNRGWVELYRRFKKKNTHGKPIWKMVDSYPYDLDIIPLVTFYSRRCGFMLAESPLEDLANLNIAHWQSTSEQRAILTTARFPILALSGGSDEGKLVIGPNKWLWSPDSQSKFYYVEHTGAAIEAGRKDLESLKDEMSEYGAQFLKKQPGAQTATARALNSAEAISPLQDNVQRFTDALEQCLVITAKWMNVELGEAKVTINTNYSFNETNSADIDALKSARMMRDISREALIGEYKRRGILSEDFNADRDAAIIEEEAMNLFGEPPDLDNEIETDRR